MKRSSLSKIRVSVLFSWLLWILLGIVCFSGCRSFREKPIPPAPIEEARPEQNLFYEILDYRDKANGETIPRWLNSFLEGGIPMVEKLAEYENYYVFISMNSGANLNALEQWSTGFSVDLDFARLVAVRIEERFLRAARTYPDDEYGSFFIALIRSASDAIWEGAVRDSDFWLFRSFPEADGTVVALESYDFFILVKVEKTLLVPQIATLFQSIKLESPLSTDQDAAVNRVKERFFEGF